MNDNNHQVRWFSLTLEAATPVLFSPCPIFVNRDPSKTTKVRERHPAQKSQLIYDLFESAS